MAIKRGILIFSVLSLTIVFLISHTLLSLWYAQEKYITAKEAYQHIGEFQTVCGTVASTKYYTKGKRQPTFLNLDQPYPKHIFTIVIWRDDRPKFKQPPESFYMGKKICVKGMITTYREKPQIIVSDPSQIIIVPSR